MKLTCPHCKAEVREERLLQIIFDGDSSGNTVETYCESCEGAIECNVRCTPELERSSGTDALIFEY